MKKMIVSLMLILGMFAFAAESDPSATVGYVKYSNVVGNNFVALPMTSGFSMASSFEAYDTSNVYKFDSGTQEWVGADMLFPGFWNNDFAVTAGQPYWIYCTAAGDLVIHDEVQDTYPGYNLVAGNNGVMVPLAKSTMTAASSYETETGAAVTNVYKYDQVAQGWFGADMLFPGFWNNDFAVGIADPHWVYSASALTWPSKNEISVTEHDGEIPHGAPKGTPKGVYVGVLDNASAEYVAGTITGVTFKAWLEQGAGAAITAPSLNGDGYPTIPYTEVVQEFTSQSALAMVALRGTVQFNMQQFDVWGIDNVLRVLMKDENGGMKTWYEGEASWVIDDTSLAAKGIGMEPYMAGTGAAIPLSTPSSVEGSNLPTVTKLHQNYPNPFNPTTTINFDLTSNESVKLNVYNYNGQLVKSLVNGQMNAGYHTVNFDASSLSAGVYYYTMETSNKTMTNKMVLVK